MGSNFRTIEYIQRLRRHERKKLIVMITIFLAIMVLFAISARSVFSADYTVNLEDNMYMGNDIGDTLQSGADHYYKFELTDGPVVVAEDMLKTIGVNPEEFIILTEVIKILYPLKLSDNIYLSDVVTETLEEILYLRAVIRVLRELKGELE